MAACEVSVTSTNLVLPLLNTAAILSMISMIYTFIRAYAKKKLKSTKSLFYLGLIFYIAVVMSLVLTVIRQLQGSCNKNVVWTYLIICNAIFYSSQAVFLIIILFTRLTHIFNETSFALSKCVMNFFIVLAIILATSTVSSIFGYYALQLYSPNSTVLQSIFNYIWLFGSVVYFMALIWLNCVFAYKMQKVFKLMDDKSELINIITKATVLCVVSSATTLMFMMIFFSIGNHRSDYTIMLMDASLLFDLYTNFLSIWLSYDCFYEYYINICGCCDSLCRKVTSSIFGRGTNEGVQDTPLTL